MWYSFPEDIEVPSKFAFDKGWGAGYDRFRKYLSPQAERILDKGMGLW